MKYLNAGLYVGQIIFLMHGVRHLLTHLLDLRITT